MSYRTVAAWSMTVANAGGSCRVGERIVDFKYTAGTLTNNEGLTMRLLLSLSVTLLTVQCQHCVRFNILVNMCKDLGTKPMPCQRSTV